MEDFLIPVFLTDISWGIWLDELMAPLRETVYNILTSFFDIFNLRMWGIGVWDTMMRLIGATATTTPQAFSTGAWNFLINTALDFTMFVGGSLLNAFYMVGIVRQSTNLKENFTLEIFVENVIKMLLANLLILHGIDLINILFDLSNVATGLFLIDNTPSINTGQWDLGTLFTDWLFGIVFFIVSIVCSWQILFTVYQRYITLYILITLYPIALSTIPGGHGVSSTASAWVRTFLGKTFEIVVIALALSFASYLCRGIDFGMASDGSLGSLFDGVLQTLQSIATMIIVAGSVKGVDALMNKALNL